MTLESIRLFRDVAQVRSISKAAEMNRITPSAATQQIQELERNLDVDLIDRSTRPIGLTAAGRLYNEFCRDSMRRWEEFEASLAETRGQLEGLVRVASIYSVGLSEMSTLETEFTRRAPSIRLLVSYLRPEKVYQAVVSERADLGLVSYPEETREITVTPWRTEEMVVATAPSNALAARELVAAADLRNLDFIAFDQELPIRRDIDHYLRANGVNVNVVMEFDNIQTIKEAVMLNTGVSIVPRRILRSELAGGRLAAIPLEHPGLYRPLGILQRRKRKLSRAAQLFLDVLKTAPSENTVPATA